MIPMLNYLINYQFKLLATTITTLQFNIL
jgi:hypothetical protein